MQPKAETIFSFFLQKSLLLFLSPSILRMVLMQISAQIKYMHCTLTSSVIHSKKVKLDLSYLK